MENIPKRILIIDGKLICGGVESFLMNIYRNIDRTKIQFDFLVHYRDKFYYDDEIESLGGKIYRLSFRNDKNIFKYIHDLKLFFREHPEYDIVWGHMDGLASIYLKIAKECNVKTTICHSHITSSEYSLKGCIKGFLKRNVWKYCDYRFACSTEAGKYLYGTHDFQIINNAIDVNRFLFNLTSREKIRNLNNWNDKIVIGHIGRFFPQKNHTYLLDIFEKITKLDNDFVLCLCGDGEEKNKIENLAKKKGLEDKITFTGNITNVEEYYQAFDIFVMPSLYEGLPVTGIEAQTSGLKCIFSNTISNEVGVIPENVKFLPITKESIMEWVNAIIASKQYQRKNYRDEIEEAGYSIQKLSKWITDFMLEIGD